MGQDPFDPIPTILDFKSWESSYVTTFYGEKTIINFNQY